MLLMVVAIVSSHTAVKGISKEQWLGRRWKLEEKMKSVKNFPEEWGKEWIIGLTLEQ